MLCALLLPPLLRGGNRLESQPGLRLGARAVERPRYPSRSGAGERGFLLLLTPWLPARHWPSSRPSKSSRVATCRIMTSILFQSWVGRWPFVFIFFQCGMSCTEHLVACSTSVHFFWSTTMSGLCMEVVGPIWDTKEPREAQKLHLRPVFSAVGGMWNFVKDFGAFSGANAYLPHYTTSCCCF